MSWMIPNPVLLPRQENFSLPDTDGSDGETANADLTLKGVLPGRRQPAAVIQRLVENYAKKRPCPHKWGRGAFYIRGGLTGGVGAAHQARLAAGGGVRMNDTALGGLIRTLVVLMMIAVIASASACRNRGVRLLHNVFHRRLRRRLRRLR